MDDELEILPGPHWREPCRACDHGPLDLTPELTADGLCPEHTAELRVLRLAGERVLEDDHEVSEWVELVMDLDDPDLGSDTIDGEDACEVPGMGWIEDTHGGAAFVPRCLHDLDDEDGEL